MAHQLTVLPAAPWRTAFLNGVKQSAVASLDSAGQTVACQWLHVLERVCRAYGAVTCGACNSLTPVLAFCLL